MPMIKLVAMVVAPIALSGCSLLLMSKVEQEQCKVDSDCSSLDPSLPLICEDNICVDVARRHAEKSGDVSSGKACTLDAHCGAGLVCGDDLVCAECRVDADCAGSDTRCLTDLGTCVECLEDSDCDNGGKCGSDNTCFDPVWGCAPTGDAVSSKLADWPKVSKPDFRYSMRIANVLEVVGIGNVTAYACETTNARECNGRTAFARGALSAGGHDLPTTNGELNVDFQGVPPTGFVGYLLVESSEALPTYYHFVDPLVEDAAALDRVLIMSEGVVTSIGSGADVAVDLSDPTKAMLIAKAFDCAGQNAADVHMQVDNSPDQGFLSVVNEKAPDFNAKTTTSDGVGILVNVEAGYRTLTLRNGFNGPVLRELSINLRPSSVNYVAVHPSYKALRLAQERVTNMAKQ